MIEVDVLISGLGPVGATLANLLGQQGLHVLVVERDTTVYPLPRAAHFDAEIMRVWQGLGVLAQVKAISRVAPAYEFRTAKGDVLLRFDLGAVTLAPGFEPSWMFNQPDLERVLRLKLEDYPRVETRLGTSLERFDASSNEEVRATLVDGSGAATEVRARYLVGCDGASSAVRKALKVEHFDYGFDEPWLVVDAQVRRPEKMPLVNLQICDPARPTTCIMMGPGRHRWEFMIRPGEDPQSFLDDRRVSSLLSAWVDADDVVVDRKAVYRFHGLVAKEWRRGRVILAGDAAHQTPPFAGQGMCSGIRDAANLSWKLGHVLRGEASDTILDSYQTEREPHVRALTEAAIAMGRVVCMADPEAAAQRDAALLAQRAQGLQPVPPPDPRPGPGLFVPASPCSGSIFPQQIAPGQMLDDVMGVGAWLIVRKTGDVLKPAAGSPSLRIEALDGDLMKPFAQRIITWLDEKRAEAVLVRADRYVFGAGLARDLLQAWNQAFGAHVAAT